MLASLKNHSEDLQKFHFTSGEDISISCDQNSLRITWPEVKTTQVIVNSKIVPLPQPESSMLQVDCYIGGQQNTVDNIRSGYSVWYEIALLKAEVIQNSERVEVPLESVKDRSRLYSIKIPFERNSIDAYQIRLLVQPVHDVIEEGYLTCSDLEVIVQ